MSHVLDNLKEVLSISSIRSCDDRTVRKYACFNHAINMQRILQIIWKYQAYSIALYIAMHMKTAYLYTRCPFWYDGTVHVLHLLSIPTYEQNTAFIIFSTFPKAMDEIFPKWKKIHWRIIGRRKNDSGENKDMVRWIHLVASSGFMQFCCDAR